MEEGVDEVIIGTGKAAKSGEALGLDVILHDFKLILINRYRLFYFNFIKREISIGNTLAAFFRLQAIFLILIRMQDSIQSQ